MSGERADERWLPTRSVGTILLSVISMLSQPNFSSPANVDASVILIHFSFISKLNFFFPRLSGKDSLKYTQEKLNI